VSLQATEFFLCPVENHSQNLPKLCVHQVSGGFCQELVKCTWSAATRS